jgi:hypothetical protein
VIINKFDYQKRECFKWNFFIGRFW